MFVLKEKWSRFRPFDNFGHPDFAQARGIPKRGHTMWMRSELRRNCLDSDPLSTQLMGLGTCTSKSWKGLKIKHSQIPKNYRTKDTGLVSTNPWLKWKKVYSNGWKFILVCGDFYIHGWDHTLWISTIYAYQWPWPKMVTNICMNTNPTQPMRWETPKIPKIFILGGGGGMGLLLMEPKTSSA